MWSVFKGTALFSLAAFLCIALTPPAQAKTISSRRDAAVSADEWKSVLGGENDAECSDLAVIFARGTFDKGNLGPWVGRPFYDALVAKAAGVKIAVQGVSAQDYPADLAGYVEDGGSESCAESLGRTVQEYVSRCTKSRVAIWGWSQGALCAHKSLGKLGDAESNVIALGVFGDPVGIWQDSIDFPAIPQGTELLIYCEKTTPDPLCANPLEDFPHDPVAFIDRLKDIWEEMDETHMNDAQRQAVKDIIVELPKQALAQVGHLATDVAEGHQRRWMLTPQHFWYGIDGKVSAAADDLVRVYKKAVSA
ncbi:carbohydrate esterase family 5 protein [Hypoxylon sp. FL1284]|nr:carbohydrate esterase family 5 protein [Hypoxylon sp. FL1284]